MRRKPKVHPHDTGTIVTNKFIVSCRLKEIQHCEKELYSFTWTSAFYYSDDLAELLVTKAIDKVWSVCGTLCPSKQRQVHWWLPNWICMDSMRMALVAQSLIFFFWKKKTSDWVSSYRVPIYWYSLLPVLRGLVYFHMHAKEPSKQLKQTICFLPFLFQVEDLHQHFSCIFTFPKFFLCSEVVCCLTDTPKFFLHPALAPTPYCHFQDSARHPNLGKHFSTKITHLR
jgi:hypothetical protein